jgi:polysaccharide export outer membrane protein
MRKFKLVYPTIAVFLILNISLLANAQEYLIGPDDILEITVYREDELYRKVRVSSDGYISFPLIGEVKAEGKSVSMLELLIEQMLRKYIKNPQVTVFIREYSTITVSGEVEKPGSYPLKGELSVLEAISLAGDFTKVAARNNVKVLRRENGEEKVIRVRVANIRKTGDKSKDVLLQRGDIVVVPESLF